VTFLVVCIASFCLCCLLCRSCCLFYRKNKKDGYIAIPTASTVHHVTTVPFASPTGTMDHVIEMTSQILDERPAEAKLRREEKKKRWIQDIYQERFLPKRPRDVERYKYEKKRREVAVRLRHLAARGDIELTKKQLAAANCILHFYDDGANQGEDYPKWTEAPFAEACNVLKVYDIYFQEDEENASLNGNNGLYKKWQYQSL